MISNDALIKMALSIGHHLDLIPMLNHSMPVFLSELHCSSSIFGMPKIAPNGHWQLVTEHAYPEVNNTLIAKNGASLLPKGRKLSTLETLYGTSPALETHNRIKTLILPLPRAGALILEATHAQLEPEGLPNLTPLAHHLARACRNCMTFQELEHTFHAPAPNDRAREDTYIDQLFENAQVGIIMAENDGTVMRINPEFENIFGYSLKECIGKNIDAIVASEEDRPDALAITRSVAGGRKHRFEAQRRCKDGTVKHVAVMASPIVVNSRQVAVYAFYRDVTTQRQMEAELIKAKQMEATGKLAGGIAHDFNNLLSVILGNIDLGLLDLPPESPSRRPLALAKQSCLRAHGLTQKFITFSSGGQPIKKQVDIGPILKEVAGKVFKRSAVICGFDLSKDLWPVEIDPGQFQHVFSALFSNADEAMPHGGEVVVTGRNIADENNLRSDISAILSPCIQVIVKDDGIGVSAEALPRLFDPYYSTKKTANQTGLGMGLTVAHSIVAQHGGHIQIESQENKGTQVYIDIPATPIQ